MNVLMIPTWYFETNNPLAGVFTTEQSIDMKKYCNVAIYYPFDTCMKGKYSSNIEKELLTYRSRWRKYKIPKLTNIINLIRIIREFSFIKKEFKPDIIHAHVASRAGLYSIILGKVFNIPVMITEHCPVDMMIKNRVSYYIVKFAYKRSKYIACVSNHLRDELKKIYKKINFDVIYNGIKIPDNIRVGLHKIKKSDTIHISFVANFYDKEIKGMQFLLPAIHKIIDKGHNIILHIIGGGDYQEYYIKKANELGILHNCIFYGSLSKDKTLEVVDKTHFFVSSSLKETFGCAIAEALMLGKPVVITTSGGPEDFVNERVGIIVKSGSCEELVIGIDKMIYQLDNYDKFYISDYSKSIFQIDAISRRYLTLYKELITGYEENIK